MGTFVGRGYPAGALPAGASVTGRPGEGDAVSEQFSAADPAGDAAGEQGLDRVLGLQGEVVEQALALLTGAQVNFTYCLLLG